jgi:hypothetical protein
MKTKRLPLVLLIILFASTATVYSQVPSKETKHQFGESIRRVKVWTYIGGDTLYHCYSQAITTIFDALAEKGYEIQEVYYSKKTGLDETTWRDRLVSGLDSGTALIQVVTSLVYDCTRVTSTKGSQVIVVDPSGSTSSRYQFPEMVEKGYMFDISTMVFTNPKYGISTSTDPIYRDSDRVTPPELANGIRMTMSWLPRYKHRVTPTNIPMGDQPVGAEFTAFGGYTFQSSMDITGGDVTFDPNACYGLDIGVNILRGLQVTAGYRREVTHMDVNSVKSKRETSPVALSFNYILFGAQYQLDAGEHVSFFAGGSVGGVNTYYPDKFYRDIWYLCAGVQTGVKFYLNRYFGFRIQGGFLYQIHPEGAPFLYSSQPSYFPLNANSNMFQWSTDAGIILRLGHRK